MQCTLQIPYRIERHVEKQSLLRKTTCFHININPDLSRTGTETETTDHAGPVFTAAFRINSQSSALHRGMILMMSRPCTVQRHYTICTIRIRIGCPGSRLRALLTSSHAEPEARCAHLVECANSLEAPVTLSVCLSS